tara:strand:- start:9 stop:188 length:180 start_codon:yes stop_codon:yes gene_type:complete
MPKEIQQVQLETIQYHDNSGSGFYDQKHLEHPSLHQPNKNNEVSKYHTVEYVNKNNNLG